MSKIMMKKKKKEEKEEKKKEEKEEKRGYHGYVDRLKEKASDLGTKIQLTAN